MERVRVLKDDAVEDKQGERARMASFAGAIAIADLIKTTLGPKGMDKLLQGTGRGRNVTVTNDGVTILKSPKNGNPGAEVPGEAVTTGLNVEAKKKKEKRQEKQEKQEKRVVSLQPS